MKRKSRDNPRQDCIVTGSQTASGRTRTRVEERLLSKVQTNLTGLAVFPVETFLFPLEPNIKVEDEDKSEILDHTVLQQELAALRTSILARRQKAAVKPKPAAKIEAPPGAAGGK